MIATLLGAACSPSSSATAPDAAGAPIDAGANAALDATATVNTTDAAADSAAACVPPASGTAPTYAQLYTTLFAVGDTPGHCATEGCHGEGDYNIWSCGSSPARCYAGMVGVGIVMTTDPAASIIASAQLSPLAWVSPDGPMPADDAVPNAQARDAVVAWVAACAQNN